MGRLLLLLLAAVVARSQVSFGGGNLPVTPPASTTPADQRCTVSGTIVNSLTGEPLRKAAIRLEVQNGSPPPDYSANPRVQGYAGISAGDGTFRFDGVEPGDYKLSATRTGYLRAAYGSTNWRQSGTILTLRRAQQMTGLKMAMSPQAVVTGHVIDSDGDPLEGIVVSLIHQTWRDGKPHFDAMGLHQTNDLGEYRIAEVSPGTYFVSAEGARMGGIPDPTSPVPGKPDIREVRTYYPDTTRLSAGTKIQLQPGQDLSGIDIRMQSSATYHVRGKVLGNTAKGGNFSRVTVRTSPKDDDMYWFASPGSNVSKDRSFDIAGLTPGTYTIQVFDMSGGFRLLGSQVLELGTADVNDAALMIVPPMTIAGQVRFEGKLPAGSPKSDLSDLHVELYPAEGMFGPIPQAKVSENGSFSLEEVNPGITFRCRRLRAPM